MGDRANIVVWEKPVPRSHHDEGPDRGTLYFYTHWAGSRLPLTLQEGLAWAMDRLGDDAYFARILFQHFLGGDESALNFGLSTTMGDNQYDLLVVDCLSGFVLRVPEDWTHDHTVAPIQRWTFEEYMTLKLDPKRPWESLLAPLGARQ